MNNDKEAIAQGILNNLSDRLVQFWEEVHSGDFPQGRSIVVRFDAATTERTNAKLLASAKAHLKTLSPLLRQSSLEPARLDRFAETYLEQAKEEVEREYDRIEAEQYGYGEISGGYE